MNPQVLSLLSTVINLTLAILKFVVGILTSSIALIAEALHSSLDILSSFITFLGIRISQRPANKSHPYGHYRYESIASFLVVILLVITAIWILYEAGTNILTRKTEAQFSYWGIILMIASVIVNEIMARWKYKIGNKFSSLALISDAEHTRADVLSSVAVLVGLIFIKFLPFVDSILAILVALYIFYESFHLGKETIDSLVDVSNPELEEKIQKILQENNFHFSEIKTRKIGAANFAEISLLCKPEATMAEVTALTKNLEQKLLNSLPELKQVSLLVKSHEFSETITRPRFWGRFRYRKGFHKIGPEKKGFRIVIPLKNREIAPEFGAPEYLIVDLDKEKKVVQKNIIRNPYWKKDEGAHGIKFLKSVSADKILTKQIGDNALQNLKALGIEVKIIEKDAKLNDLGYGQA